MASKEVTADVPDGTGVKNAQKARCSQCRFAGPRRGYQAHECRRHAPTAVHDPNQHCGVYQEAFVPRWPLMHGDDWCGDFERA